MPRRFTVLRPILKTTPPSTALPSAMVLAMAVGLSIALPVTPLRAQVTPLPPSASAPTIWTSLSGSLFDLQSFHGGEDGGYWAWGNGVQVRGSVERSLRRDLAVGVTGSFARLPLTVGGGACSGCEGDGTVWQAMALLRLGGGGGIGFHSVFEASAGATGFTNFTRGEDPSSVAGPPTVAAHAVVPTISAGYGLGYTLRPGLELSLAQEVGVLFYSPSSAAPGGGSSTPRFNATRLTLRYALGR